MRNKIRRQLWAEVQTPPCHGGSFMVAVGNRLLLRRNFFLIHGQDAWATIVAGVRNPIGDSLDQIGAPPSRRTSGTPRSGVWGSIVQRCL